jgi:hypothetical protein
VLNVRGLQKNQKFQKVPLFGIFDFSPAQKTSLFGNFAPEYFSLDLRML